MPSKINSIPDGKSLILFDGVCNFCNDSVNFVIDRDPTGRFLYASLQSEYGTELASAQQKPLPDSIVLLENNKIYMKSTAALRIAAKLTGLWPLLYTFIIIPAFIRNLVYDFIAMNRYKWFGKKEECMIPAPEVRARFLS